MSERLIRVSLHLPYPRRRRRRTLYGLQRLFSMFPAGLPGFALLLLRLSVVISGFATGPAAALQASWWLYASLGLTGLALCIGVFTPIFATLSLAIQLGQLVLYGNELGQRAVGILIAMALSLLGPGAFSVDSYRFGRRRVRFPEDYPPRGT